MRCLRFRSSEVLGLLLALSLPVSAQQGDFGLGATASVEYKLARGLKVEAEAEVRSQNTLRDPERWAVAFGMSYKLPWSLKADAGYSLIYRYHPEALSSKGNLITDYWAPRHRWYLGLTEQRDWGRWRVSLRERYQLTHSPLQYVPRYRPDGQRLTDAVRAGDQEHLLRSRLQATYNIRHCSFDPTISIEMLNDLQHGGIDQMRYTFGIDYHQNKHTTWTLQLRYKDRDDADEADGFLLGLGYNYTF